MTDRYVTTGAAGGGAGTEGDPWTLAEATASVVAGDTVFVKAGTYSADDSASSAVIDLDVAGTISSWIAWVGYTTTIADFTPGDAQPVIIDASVNTLTHAMLTTTITANGYNRFRGFRFTGGSGHGVNQGTGGDAISYFGCKFDTNGGRGFLGDNANLFIACEFTGNTTNSIDADNNTTTIGCKFHNEPANDGFAGVVTVLSNSVHVMNLAYNNGNGTTFSTAGADVIHIGNTIDGDGQAASTGIRVEGSSNILGPTFNNIFFDLDFGVEFGSAVEDLRSRGFNLFFSNTTDYETLSLDSTDVAGTSDPFTDSASRDYTLKVGSEALDAGLDAGNI